MLTRIALKTIHPNSDMRGLSFQNLVSFSHICVQNALRNIAMGKNVPSTTQNAIAQKIIAIDATCGNGHDTCFLAKTLHSVYGNQDMWKILAFDVQKTALANSFSRISELELGINAKLHNKIEFIHQSNEFAKENLAGQKVAVAMYNLGYLPGSDKKITTKAESTLHSLKQILNCFIEHGVLSVHCYAGHVGGDKELRVVEKFLTQLPSANWQVLKYHVCNKTKNPETLFIAEKTGL